MNKPYIKGGVMFLPDINSPTIDKLSASIGDNSKELAKKQEKLTAGKGINIEYINGKYVISCNVDSYGGEVEERRSVKILHVGNSYMRDATSYIVPLLRELLPNVDVTIGIIHNDGCSLQRYHEEVFPSGETYLFDYCDKLAWQWKRMHYPLFVQGTTSLTPAFDLEDWDIVTFQQKSDFVADYATYQPYLRQDIKTIYTHLPKSCRLTWFMGMPKVVNDVGVSMFNGAAAAAQMVLEESACEDILPCGTAVQNLRTIPAFRAMGTQGGMQTSNHLHTGIGMLAEGYVYILWLAKMLGLPAGVYGSQYRPVDGDARQTHVTSVPEGISDENCRLAQIAAMHAIKRPFEITDMNDEVESSQ